MRTLVIGNKNYSSWSLRPWLLMRQFGLAFEEVRLPLDTPEFHRRIGDYSPTARVPVLRDGDEVIWDSLAICETVNERWLGDRGWPQDGRARAAARCAVAEMHSGFAALRTQLPMNCRRSPAAPHWDASAERDIARVQAIWADLRSRFGAGGAFLCGDFGIVDAMYAPVCVRFRAYGVPVDANAAAFIDSIYSLPAMREWLLAAAAELESLPPTDGIAGIAA
ncbi:glutathione S-transferase family protein [Arenimonas sp.]|uniref:glutathione S-transferase family protein n=1 Tax=Arenimonas sp. TaxID=1872635 RepID=UPI0039E723D3